MSKFDFVAYIISNIKTEKSLQTLIPILLRISVYSVMLRIALCAENHHVFYDNYAFFIHREMLKLQQSSHIIPT